jgi:GvpD gas vesicle protein
MLFRRKPSAPPAPPPPLRWDPVREPPGHFSSGIAELDGVLGGGYRVGSVTAVEGDPTVGNDDVLTMTFPAIANFLALGRGALVVPPAGVPAARFRAALLRCIAAETFDARVRVLDFTRIDPVPPWLVPMARYSRVETMRATLKAEAAARGPTKGPFVEIDSLDTLENTANAEFTVRMLTHSIGRIKETGILGVVWIRPTSRSAPAISGMADVHLALSRPDGRLTLRGIRPAFPARSIDWRESDGQLRVELGLA